MKWIWGKKERKKAQNYGNNKRQKEKYLELKRKKERNLDKKKENIINWFYKIEKTLIPFTRKKEKKRGINS